MCNHKYNDDVNECCELDILFSKNNPKKKKIQETIDLPHDSKGKCIFHSNDLSWKRKNNFTSWLKKLIVLFDKHYIKDDVIELDEFILVGDSLLVDQDIKYRLRTNSGDEQYCIIFENILCNKHIVFRKAIFEDAVILERCFFRRDLIFTDSHFSKGMSISHIKVGGDLYIDHSHFNNSIVIDSNNSIFGSWCISNSIFAGDTNFGEITISDRSIIEKNIFKHNISNTNFNCFFCSGLEFRNNEATNLGFDNCNFYYDSIFSNLKLSGQFLMTQPLISGQLKFVGSEDEFLFNTQTTIEIDSENFEENGLIIFDYCNLLELGTVFIANCRELEIEQKIQILPSCKVERLTVVHVYQPYKELKSNIIEDFVHVVCRYFRHWHSIDISVNIIRNRKESWIKVIFKTTDDISEERFNTLLREFPATISDLSIKTNEAEDIRRTVHDLFRRISISKAISDSEIAEILTLKFNINAKDIYIDQPQIGMLVSGQDNNFQDIHIKQIYKSENPLDFEELMNELEKVENAIRNEKAIDIIEYEQFQNIKKAVIQKDEGLLMQYLKKLPLAFFRFAKDISANFLAGVIQKAVGL